MAIGVFVAFSPLLGFQMITAVLLAMLLCANRAAALASVWVSNPFTALPIYTTTYLVGQFVLPGHVPIDVEVRLRGVVFDDQGEWLNLATQFCELYSLGGEALVPLGAGGLIVGLPMAIVGYILTRCALDFGHRHLPRRRKRDQSSFPRSVLPDGREQGRS